MQPKSVSEVGYGSPRSSRAPSISSEFSPLSSSGYSLPSSVSPAPAYVAVSAASQIVTDHINAQLRQKYGLDSSASPFGDVALFSEDALVLVNNFIDNLLYTFLATAKSTSLSAMRPAIVEVLKPRLARPAIESADQELQDLLAGEDEDEDEDPETNTLSSKSSRKFDLEGVWKRTRLRVMVYTRLGEMEDEDEEQYLDQIDGEEGLEPDHRGLVSWSAAIFLTAVVEYVAEQTIVIAGQSAFSKKKKKRTAKDGSQDNASERLRIDDDGPDSVDRFTVEEGDVEKVALNSTLGRLWRTWRKRLRPTVAPPLTSPRNSMLRHRNAAMGALGGVRTSMDGMDTPVFSPEEEGRRFSADPAIEIQPTETEIAANIPLPISENDVAEIVFPGLANQFDDSNGTNTPVGRTSGRPNSVVLLSSKDGAPKEKARRPLSMPPLAIQPIDTAIAAAPKSVPETEGVEKVVSPTAPSTASLKALTEERTEDEKSPLGELEDSGEKPIVVDSHRISLRTPPVSPQVVKVFVGEPSPSIEHANHEPIYENHAEEGLPSDDGEGIGVAKTSNLPIASPNVHEERAKSATPEHVVQNDSDYDLDVPEQPYHHSAPRSPLTIETDNSVEHQIISSYGGRGPVLSPVRETAASPEDGAGDATSSSRVGKHKHSKSRSSRKSRSQTPDEGAGRQSIDGSGGLTRLSTGSRGSDTMGSRARGLSARMSQEEREREFDSLLKGDETVKLTLTPQAMRDIDGPDPSPITRKRDSKSVTKVTVYPPQTSGTNGTNGTKSRLSTVPQADAENNESAVSAAESMPPPPTPQSQQHNKIRKSRPSAAAREPRIHGESLRDFADFIRSTGPSRDSGSEQKEITIPPKMMGLSGLARKASGRVSNSHNDGPTTRPRVQLEARNPSASKATSSHTAELMDFLNAGPPSKGGRNHHDSDDYTVSSTAPSKPSTINSRTGLIPSQQMTSGPYGAEPQIVRTRRRIKDPYAIDTDSEDEDLDEALLAMPPSKHRGRQEESLIDFLRSVEPPKNNDPTPLSPSNSAAVSAIAAGITSPRKASAPGPRSPSVRSNTMPVLSTNSGANGVSSPIRSPLSPASQERFNNSLLPRGSVGRDASGLTRSSTSDLAEFLRSSGPSVPPPSAGANNISGPVGLARKSSGREGPTGKMKGFFGRKKSNNSGFVYP